jgi:hypothetical protein
VLVPPTAVVQRDGQGVVFVVADGKAQQRSVKPAAQDIGQMKLIPDGVKAGEQVVLTPPPNLHDGAEVRIEGGGR